MVCFFDNEQRKIFLSIYLDRSQFLQKFKNQISYLSITINDYIFDVDTWKLVTEVFTCIFTKFSNLTHLEYSLSDTCGLSPSPTFERLFNSCYSFNIIYLRVKLYRLDDCVYLLDGRLNQLQTFIVQVGDINHCSFIPDQMVRNLSCDEKIFFVLLSDTIIRIEQSKENHSIGYGDRCDTDLIRSQFSIT